LPSHLFLSVYRAIQPFAGRFCGLSDDEFIRKILSPHGTQREIFADPEHWHVLLSVFRVDFALCETYIYTLKVPLAIPFTVFGGTQDNRVSQNVLEAWREHTDTTFTLQMLAGDHFFWQGMSISIWPCSPFSAFWLHPLRRLPVSLALAGMCEESPGAYPTLSPGTAQSRPRSVVRANRLQSGCPADEDTL
jgi:hypothetical protein